MTLPRAILEGVARRPPRDEDGSAIIAVVSLGLLLVVVTAAMTGRIVGGTRASLGALEREQSLAAAEAGLSATLERLATDPLTAEMLAGLAPVSLLDRPWHVPAGLSTDGDAGISARVALAREDQGELRIVVSGRAGNSVRALEALVRPRSVADHGWLTDLEILDPIVLGIARGHCRTHGGAVALADERCVPTVYGERDAFDGPFHSNDLVRVDGAARFGSTATSALLSEGVSGPPVAGFDVTGTLGLPPPFGLGFRSRIDLVDAASDVLAPLGPTCRLRGPTVVRFDGPMVRLRSPLSASPSVDAGPELGCNGVDLAMLDTFQSVELPERAVIEIVPADPSSCGSHPLDIGQDDDRVLERRCFAGDAFVWGDFVGQRAVVAHDDVVLLWDVVPTHGVDDASSVAALIAGDSVVLRRPVTAPLRVVAPFGQNAPFAAPGSVPYGQWPLDAPNATATTWDAPMIVASLVALRGSFRLENPTWGREHPGPLTVVGSITQRYRGPLRWERRTASGALQATMGYDLELTYDRRLLHVTPPALPGLGDPSLRLMSLREVAPPEG
jgi:hypothetical protein